METKVTVAGILEFKALTMSKGVFNQIEKLCHNKDGELIGYVVDDTGMTTFVGKENGKLYRTMQNYMVETWDAQGKPDVYGHFNEYMAETKAKLPQIYIK